MNAISDGFGTAQEQPSTTISDRRVSPLTAGYDSIAAVKLQSPGRQSLISPSHLHTHFPPRNSQSLDIASQRFSISNGLTYTSLWANETSPVVTTSKMHSFLFSVLEILVQTLSAVSIRDVSGGCGGTTSPHLLVALDRNSSGSPFDTLTSHSIANSVILSNFVIPSRPMKPLRFHLPVIPLES